MSLPSRISSSFWVFDSETSTPSNILTCRTVCKRFVNLMPFAPGERIAIPFRLRSSWFQQHDRSPELCSWWGSVQRRHAFCIGNPTLNQNGATIRYINAYLGNSSNHIVNHTPDCSQTGYVLSAALPYSQGDFGCFAFDDSNIHIDMPHILRQGSTRSGHSDETGLDCDVNTRGYIEFFSFEDVPHLKGDVVRYTLHPQSRLGIHLLEPWISAKKVTHSRETCLVLPGSRCRGLDIDSSPWNGFENVLTTCWMKFRRWLPNLLTKRLSKNRANLHRDDLY